MCTSELVLYWSCRCRYLGCKSINDIIFPVCLANSDGGSEHALGLSLPQLLRLFPRLLICLRLVR